MGNNRHTRSKTKALRMSAKTQESDQEYDTATTHEKHISEIPKIIEDPEVPSKETAPSPNGSTPRKGIESAPGDIAPVTKNAPRGEEELVDGDTYEHEATQSAPAPGVEESEQLIVLEEDLSSITVEAAEQFEQAKQGMIWSADRLFQHDPNIAAVLRLHNVGDLAKVEVPFHGITYEVTWKIVGTYEEDITRTAAADVAVDNLNEEISIAADAVSPNDVPTTADELAQESPDVTTSLLAERKEDANKIVEPTTLLQTAAPLSESRPPTTVIDSDLVPRCKFGKSCTKGKACPFDHGPKQNLCVWVNTSQGCTNGVNCEYSHKQEGRPCTRSNSRRACPNGYSCAFKHQDDYIAGGHSSQTMKLPGLDTWNKRASLTVEGGQRDATSTTESKPTLSAPNWPSSGVINSPGNVRQPDLVAGTKRSYNNHDVGDISNHNLQPPQKKVRNAEFQNNVHNHANRGSYGAAPRGSVRGRGHNRGRGRERNRGVARGGWRSRAR